MNALLADNVPSYLSRNGSITALSYMNGVPISYSTAMGYLNSSSSLYKLPFGLNYRVSVASLVNAKATSSLVQILTVVDPDADAIVPFILNVRDTLQTQMGQAVSKSLNMKLYLFGGYSTQYDLQNALYAYVPLLIVSTVLVVLGIMAINFGSVVIPLRLAGTIFVSLAWSFGLTVLVYQPGPGQEAFKKLTPDALAPSSGLYWIIPIMAFSVLVGLALDYDIFLMTRVVEYRKQGWSDRASVCLAVEKTGNIITCAGLIMSISFAGLLIPQTVVLNQYGFILFIGVAIDTFIIRTLIVPAVFVLIDNSLRTALHLFQGSSSPTAPGAAAAVAGGTSSRWDLKTISVNVNWWPTIMPDVLLTPEEEDEALLAGFSDPALFLESRKNKGQIAAQDPPPANNEAIVV